MLGRHYRLCQPNIEIRTRLPAGFATVLSRSGLCWYVFEVCRSITALSAMSSNPIGAQPSVEHLSGVRAQYAFKRIFCDARSMVQLLAKIQNRTRHVCTTSLLLIFRSATAMMTLTCDTGKVVILICVSRPYRRPPPAFTLPSAACT